MNEVKPFSHYMNSPNVSPENYCTPSFAAMNTVVIQVISKAPPPPQNPPVGFGRLLSSLPTPWCAKLSLLFTCGEFRA